MSTNNLVKYKDMSEWDSHSLPKGFRNRHNTRVGTWAKLTIFSGELKYYAMDENDNILDTFVFDKDSDIPFVEPQAWHKVEPLTDDLRCQLSFYCQADEYYQNKYGLSATHTEAVEVTQHITSGKVLDLGCGGGRNALYMQRLGFDVTAFDINQSAIENLQHIIDAENLEHIRAYAHDAELANISEKYDLIMSLVVLMFLQSDKVPDVIINMQESTVSGGYNLIVCAMDSEDYPMSARPLPFGFGFKPGELKGYYDDWEIIKYNEDVGHLHRTDADGNQIALRFATLVAKK